MLYILYSTYVTTYVVYTIRYNMHLLYMFDPQPLHSEDVTLAPATGDFNGTSLSQVVSPLCLFGELAVSYCLA